jgi:hypothetical protein
LDETKPYEELHIIQGSWAVGAFDFNPQQASARPRKYVTKIIRPDGFVISAGVADKYGVSQERALAEGLPLREVLKEMLDDVYFETRSKGRLCMHHLEHEGRVVDAELRRAGLDSKCWQQICSNGLCSMNPHLSQWIFDMQGPPLKSKSMSFDRITTKLLGEKALRMQAGEKRWLVTRKLHQQVHKHKADLALTFDKRQKLEAHNQQPIQDNNDPPPA